MKTSSPTPTAVATSAPWCSTTTAIPPPAAPSTIRPPTADKQSGHLRQRRLKEGLELKADPALILAYRDSLTGLEYLRRSVNLAEHGLTVELHAYQCHVFLDWRELRATAEKPWDRLCDHLAGRGVPNLEDALIGLELRPAHDALRRLLDPALVRKLAELY